MKERVVLKLINDDKHANAQYLAAAMTWPDDFSRGNLLTEAGIKNLADAKGDPNNASILQTYNDEVRKALWPGFVTGKIFIATLYGLSLGKAQFLAARTLDGALFDGKKRLISVDSARSHWRKFRNVSHLWAAYSMLEDSQKKKNAHLIAQLARKFLEMAVQNDGFPKWCPLIVETDFGLFDGAIDLPPLPQFALEILEKYEPHSKTWGE